MDAVWDVTPGGRWGRLIPQRCAQEQFRLIAYPPIPGSGALANAARIARTSQACPRPVPPLLAGWHPGSVGDGWNV